MAFSLESDGKLGGKIAECVRVGGRGVETRGYGFIVGKVTVSVLFDGENLRERAVLTAWW